MLYSYLLSGFPLSMNSRKADSIVISELTVCYSSNLTRYPLAYLHGPLSLSLSLYFQMVSAPARIYFHTFLIK